MELPALMKSCLQETYPFGPIARSIMSGIAGRASCALEDVSTVTHKTYQLTRFEF